MQPGPSVHLCLLQVRSDRDKFTIYLDVKHFSPDDLSVKVTDDYVEIQGKHGERQVVLLFSLLYKSPFKNTAYYCLIGTHSMQTGVSII